MASRKERDYYKGLRALEQLDFKQAARIGARLIEQDYPGGYEVRARALHAMGSVDEPLRLLEAATEKFPDVLVNWSLLGEMYSNAQRFGEALAAFQQFRQAGGDTTVADFNLALVYGRQGRFELALTAIDGAFGGEMPDHVVMASKASYLIQLERFDDALKCSEEAVGLEETAYGLATVAQSLFGLGRTDEANKLARAALDLDLTDRSALNVLIRSNPETTPDSKVYQVLVSGRYVDGKPKAKGFSAAFLCIADSPSEAIEFFQALHPSTTDLSVKKHSVVRDAPEGNKGVVAIQPE